MVVAPTVADNAGMFTPMECREGSQDTAHSESLTSSQIARGKDT